MYGIVTVYAFVIAAAFALAVAWYDLKTMTIPNWLNAAAAGVFLAIILLVLPLDEVTSRLIGAGVVLVVGLVMFFAGGMGGGDVKAATAFALLVAPPDRSVVLVLLALTGLLGLLLFAGLRRTPLANGTWAVWSAKGKFPYGLALAATLIIYMGLTVLFMR